MKLKEKFLSYVYCFMGSGMLTNDYDEEIAEWNAKKCETIADEFAIGFGLWFALHHTEEVFYEENYAKEMLDKFKKEKGL